MANPNDNVVNYRLQKLAEDIDGVSAQLKTLSPADIPRLAERIFVNVFLPLFAGDETLIYDATFNTWVSFAGSPYTDVHVVDTKNNILFTVPPLLDRSAINPVNRLSVSIAHVVTTAGQFARIHPTQGSVYLHNELSKRAIVMKVPANILNNLEIWNNIFKRYGRPEIMTIEEKVASEIPKINPDDEFEPL